VYISIQEYSSPLITNRLFSGFKTNAVTRPNVTIPAGLVDIVITISRGNLVITYSIVATIAKCNYVLPDITWGSQALTLVLFRDDYPHFTFGNDHYCFFRLPAERRSASYSCGNIIRFHSVEAEYAWCSCGFRYALLFHILCLLVLNDFYLLQETSLARFTYHRKNAHFY